MTKEKSATPSYFKWIAVVLPLLFFVVLEGVLHIFMPNRFVPLVREVTYDNVAYYQINRGYLKRFFPENTGTVPEFKESVFRRKKQRNTVRVFCLGGSSMFGTPYQMNANIPGMLRRQLRHLYPENDIEVINLGASAINSNVVKQLAGEIIQFEPDLICVYMGHNEFYGPDGVSADIISRHFPAFIPIKYKLRNLRVYQLMRSLLGNSSSSSGGENLMRQVSRGNLVSLQSPESEFVFHNFEKNLDEILSLFESKHIPVIISDVASNLLFHPFVSDSTINSVSIKNELNTFYRYAADGKLTEKEQQISELLNRDSTNAALNFYKGLLEKQSGNFKSALFYLNRAKDYDLLKFRAPSRINKIIRRAASRHTVTFISGYQAILDRSKNGIPGFGLFWEHLHPNINGYYALTREFLAGARKVDREKGAWELRTNELPLQTDSLHIPWIELAYADMAIYNLTGRWPFQNFHFKPWLRPETDTRLQHIAADLYNRKLVWDEACYRSAEVFEESGRIQDAVTTYRAILEDYPLNFFAWYRLGRLYNLTGKPEKAFGCYQKSVKADSNFVLANLELGLIEINKGLLHNAKKHLQRAVDRWIPKQGKGVKATALYGLGAVYANEGKLELAQTLLKQAVELKPDYYSARQLLQKIQQINHH